MGMILAFILPSYIEGNSAKLTFAKTPIAKIFWVECYATNCPVQAGVTTLGGMLFLPLAGRKFGGGFVPEPQP